MTVFVCLESCFVFATLGPLNSPRVVMLISQDSLNSRVSKFTRTISMFPGMTRFWVRAKNYPENTETPRNFLTRFCLPWNHVTENIKRNIILVGIVMFWVSASGLSVSIVSKIIFRLV